MLGSVDESNAVGRIGEELLAGLHGFENAHFAFHSEISFDPALSGNPAYQRLGLVGIELVCNKDPTGFEIGGNGAGDMLEEILFGSGLTDCGSKDFPCGHFEVGNQTQGAMPDIVLFA